MMLSFNDNSAVGAHRVANSAACTFALVGAFGRTVALWCADILADLDDLLRTSGNAKTAALASVVQNGHLSHIASHLSYVGYVRSVNSTHF